jgi:23S rRNA (uracil1939-C5)-methyltransferase
MWRARAGRCGAGRWQLQRGPNYAAPVCRHFGTCGGCTLQHVGDAALADFVRDRVVCGRGQGWRPSWWRLRIFAAGHAAPGILRAARVGGAVALGFPKADRTRSSI